MFALFACEILQCKNPQNLSLSLSLSLVLPHLCLLSWNALFLYSLSLHVTLPRRFQHGSGKSKIPFTRSQVTNVNIIRIISIFGPLMRKSLAFLGLDPRTFSMVSRMPSSTGNSPFKAGISLGLKPAIRVEEQAFPISTRTNIHLQGAEPRSSQSSNVNGRVSKGRYQPRTKVFTNWGNIFMRRTELDNITEPQCME